MARGSTLETEVLTIRKSVISDYVRLCIAEGIRPGEAYREMERKLKAVRGLKNQKRHNMPLQKSP